MCHGVDSIAVDLDDTFSTNTAITNITAKSPNKKLYSRPVDLVEAPEKTEEDIHHILPANDDVAEERTGKNHAGVRF